MLAALDPQTRQHLEGGFVEIAYTPDMVYVALGNPSRIKHKATADGDVEIWVYRNIALPGNEGFRGLTYDTNFEITATVMSDMLGVSSSVRPPNPAQQQGSKSLVTGDGKGYGVNLTALASATTIADMPMGTLYVFFYNGRVFKMVLGD